MPRALKVYRTAIGFHDAYVAAPSQKAALEAWGAASNLFAIGAAEVVTDPKLVAEPLGSPGKVVKRARGTLSEYLGHASSRDDDKSATGRSRRATNAVRKPKPRPSRADLTAAEAALAQAEESAKTEIAQFQRREAELRKQREAVEKSHETLIAKLEKRLARQRVIYEGALDRWRDG